jgi:hypothetical protein
VPWIGASSEAEVVEAGVVPEVALLAEFWLFEEPQALTSATSSTASTKAAAPGGLGLSLPVIVLLRPVDRRPRFPTLYPRKMRGR